MTRYNQLFDQMAPKKTDDEMLQAVLEGRNEESSGAKARPFRRPVIIAAAAVAAASVGITAAGASNGWDFTGLFQGFFSNVLNGYPEYAETGLEYQAITADLSQMGVNLDETVDFGYGTVHFTGAIADSNIVMLTYELRVDDDVLEEYYSEHSNAGETPWAAISCDFSDSDIITKEYGSPLSMPVDLIGENGVDSSRTNVYFYEDGYLSKDRVLEIKFDMLSLYAADNSWWDLKLRKPIALSLPLDFMNTDRIEVSPNVEITHDNCRYFLEDVVITPLNITWYTQPGESIEHLPVHSDPLIFRFRDGTEVKNYSITESAEYKGDRELHSALLDKPIDINDLSSVTIGDYTINLE